VIGGVGIDAVTISRMKKWLENEGLLRRYFAAEEVEAIKKRSSESMVSSLAAHFAAKEALGKALGTGLANIVLKDIMIVNDINKKPELEVKNSALAAVKASGAKSLHVSLTHEGDTAIAVVVLEV
jgi:holo-[acyl-carrier protein] synthase